MEFQCFHSLSVEIVFKIACSITCLLAMHVELSIYIDSSTKLMNNYLIKIREQRARFKLHFNPIQICSVEIIGCEMQ